AVAAAQRPPSENACASPSAPSCGVRCMTEAVVFDMDGVLIDSGAHHHAAWRALLEEIGEEPAHPEPWRLTIGRPSEEAVPLLLNPPLSDYEVRRPPRAQRDPYLHFPPRGPPTRTPGGPLL